MAKSEASDYIQPIYKERALKHLVKLAGGKRAANALSDEQKKKMMSARVKLAQDMQFNTLKWFRPFKYQEKFFETGAKSTRRGMIAANRAGKTIASTYETAYHLTGRYPDSWKGKRWDKPIIAMAAGESWEQVAKTLQSKLLGGDDIKQAYKLGTGSIPRECIDEKSYRSDGANVLSIEIWHISGGKSKLYFSNYTQQVRHLQGFELDLVVLDEQPPDETFSELVVRTAARNGQVICSFTPLKGMSGLVRKFWDQVEGYSHVRVTWDDIPYENEWGEPFFTQEERDQLARDFMPWERKCRMEGIPLIGKGVVFPLLEWPTYKSIDFDLRHNEKMERLISFDLGIKNDPTVISFFFRDPTEEIIYLHKQITIPSGETPDEYVHYLLDRETKGVPIALPHDASAQGRYTLTEQSVREVFEDSYGLNCIPGAILNPPNDQGKVTNHKAYGINIMRMCM